MKKRVLVSAISLVLLFSLVAVSALAAGNTIEMQIGNPEATVYGEAMTMDAPPVIVNDRTMVPLRFVAEAMGVSLYWDGETATVFIMSGESVTTLQIGLEYALKDNGKIALEAAPVIVNDRTMVPLHLIAEVFGLGTDWNAETETVTITAAE